MKLILGLGPSELETFVGQVFSQLFIEGFVHGNVEANVRIIIMLSYLHLVCHQVGGVYP